MENILITKRSGDKVLYDSTKLKHSLERSGATPEEADYIIENISEKIYSGISTHTLYKLAYSLLKKRSNRTAGRYRLKKAIHELGPTGFPFEKFIGEIFKNLGYDVQVDVIAQGECITHEVDVIATKDKTRIIIECKFHGDTSRKSDVKVPLYIKSRFLDLKANFEKEEGNEILDYQGWIVTNTRFTEDAINYGKCAGLHLISWDYPPQGSLREMIDFSGLHPITALQSLTKAEKKSILEAGVVLCRNLNGDFLHKLGFSPRKTSKVLKEVEDILSE